MATLIIGTGISATTYAATFQRLVGETVTMTSGKHLWENLDPEHIMGQPKNLLVGQTLGTNSDRIGPEGVLNPKTFLKAGVFAQEISKLKKAAVNEFLADKSWVQGVKENPRGGYLVTLSSGAPSGLVSDKVKVEEVHFDRVVFAPGAGPNRPLTIGSAKDAPKVDIKSFNGHIVAGDEFMSPDFEPPKTLLSTKSIAIYGGSATASWVAELAILKGYNVKLWFTRPGEGNDAWDAKSRFAAAFPAGGRNKEIEEDLEDQRKVLELQELMLTETPKHAFVSMYLKNNKGQTELYVPDLLVYSLGYAHTEKEGVRAMLSASILEKMVAFYDFDRAISEDRCLLAVGVPDGSLVIVGSGMSSQFGFKINEKVEINQVAKPYKDISKTLPPASAPTEGVAMLMAGIEAFTRYIPVTVTPEQEKAWKDPTHKLAWNINFNLANRTQLATWVASETDLAPFAANLAVDLIVKVRALKGNTFGLTETVIKRFLTATALYWNELKRINAKIPEEELRKGASEDGTAYYEVNLHELVADFLIKNGGGALIDKLGQKETVAAALKK
jgi:hypothetical protein